MTKKEEPKNKQEGHDGPVSLHWLIRESIHSKHYITWELV